MSGLATRWGRFLANRWAGRLQDPLVLPGVLVVAVAAAGFVGYRDWQDHRPVEGPGRSAYLCRLPTGPDTPLGRLLPDGDQDSEERTDSVLGHDPRSCVIRIDGRTVLTLTSVGRQGGLAMPSEVAKHPDARPFDTGLGASWPGGAAVAANCLTGKNKTNDYFELEIVAGEAVRTPGDGLQAGLEQLARAALDEPRKEQCS
ncbi:hypothetical protein [Kitasatospora brasiliensis]|uniref:hypothetical protein n=1 Tax=Kitasatospora brasiliensis TaxID=3058040 RepID=UPI002930256C|nr:hypothetical protein [Kitasatospora sp. K002]